MSDKIDEIPAKTFFTIAFLISLIGAALLLIFDFGWFNASNYYLGVYIWGGIGAWNGLISLPILISAFFLLYCMGISLLVLKSPEKIPDKKYVTYGLYASVIVFILTIIGAIVFAVEMTLEDAWWNYDAGFYGAIIGSSVTAICFYFGLKKLEL